MVNVKVQEPCIEVPIFSKSVDETTHLGNIELFSSLRVEKVLEHVQNLHPLLNGQESAMDDLEVFLEKEGEEINLQPYKGKTMKDIGFTYSTDSTYSVKVMKPKQKMALCVQEAIEDDLLLGASASPTTAEFSNISSDKEYYHSESLPISEDLYIAPTQESYTDTSNYVGLVNQAMTCYLNSLLQALYMTPEFRNALYNWEFDGQNESRSIPFQLQKLFLNLQTSSKSAVETTDLTTSFGWQGSDAWQQHDIQELCRVMFDALEQKFKDTKQANLINDLYEGKMLDYVRCLECSTEKSREDTLLDIPLPVRPFGSQMAYNSVEEALRAFVQPEILDGNNQYFCEKCDKKCNAHKGLKFTKFPYLLTLHLKRFDFDYNTLHRIKLNDKVVFSEMLNLNSFIQNLATCEDQSEEKENIVKYDDCCTTDSGSALDDEGCQSVDASSTLNGQDVNCSESDEGIDVSSGNNHKLEATGPYIYDLFSIMIHSGSATGGHYYAYIKDFDKQQWLCFNDQCVTRITEDDIRKTYGGNHHRSYYSGTYASSTNAYMLMYRQIDKDRNAKAISVDEFPPHIRNLLKQMREKEELDRKNKEKENDLVKINVYCFHPAERRLMDVKVSVMIDSTLEETVAYTAFQRFKLEGIVAKEDCRLVKYNKSRNCIDYSFESDKIKFCDIAGDFPIPQSDWFLEFKPPNASWITYKPGAVNMKVYPINLQLEELEEPVVIRVDENQTVDELKQNLSELLCQHPDSLEVIMEKKCNDFIFFENNKVIDIENKNLEYNLYVGTSIDEDSEKSCRFGKLRKAIEKVRNIISLRVSLPNIDRDTLENLSIPLLDPNQNIDRLDLASGNKPLSNLRGSPQQTSSVICSSDGFGDQSNSEDSSLSDSDRTLVGDAPGELMGMSSNSSNSPADQHMVSPTDPAEDNYNYEALGHPTEEMYWDDDETSNEACRMSNLYFKVTNIVKEDATEQCPFSKYCKVLVDRRMTLDRLKKHLEPYVRVPVEYFKVYRHIALSVSPEHNVLHDLNETLHCLKDGDCLSIRLERVLKKDESSVKVQLLRPNHQEPISFLFDHIIAKGQTVGQVLKDIIVQAKKRHSLDFCYSKSRLREKAWKRAGKVFLTNQTFGEDIPLNGTNREIFLQELDEAERVTSVTQTVLFVRRWRPSVLRLDPLQEIVVNTTAWEELKTTISELSGIPLENCEVAPSDKCIPGDMHCLEINTALDWKSSPPNFDGWPVYAGDGNIFMYRDNREEMMSLTPAQREEIKLQEYVRLGQVKSSKTYSPGKERALKIYLDTSPSKREDNCID